MNVGTTAYPLNDAAGFITYRHGTHGRGAVLAIMAPQALPELQRSACADSFLPQPKDFLAVFRVDCVCPSEATRLLGGLAGKRLPLGRVPQLLAVPAADPDDLRRSMHQER